MAACEMRRCGERGQGILEYTLLIVLVAMVVLLVLIIFGPELGNAFSMITHGI